MTKKDFIVIANALKQSRIDIEGMIDNNQNSNTAFFARSVIERNFTEFLKANNPKFNEVKFLNYIRD